MKKFSIIIPAYNAEKTIRACIDDIRNYSYDLKKVELIVVNDGSIDRTMDIVNEVKNKETALDINIINKNNGGVSSARNAGLKEATGEYILFLDSDDKLSPNSLADLETFLTENPVHIAVYNIEYTSNGRRHWRNEYLKKSGVYDANKFCYGALTTVNFCIRNRGTENELFDVNLYMHEDEEFATRNALIEGRFGFCQEAVYLYDNTNETSATNTKLNPYYSFDQSISVYEKIIDESIRRVGTICEYVQAVIVNDLGWKLRSNVLFSESKKLQNVQVQKIRGILQHINPEIILNHPNLDKFHKHFFLRLSGVTPKVYFLGQKIMFEVAGYREHVKQNEIYISRIRREGDRVRFVGFYKTYITDYINRDEVKIYALQGNRTIECVKRKTYYSHHRSKTRTNDFLGFELLVDLEYSRLSFFVTIKNRAYRINKFAFKDYGGYKDLNIRIGDCLLFFDRSDGEFRFEKLSLLSFVRSINKDNILGMSLISISACLRKFSNISIYNDREGVFDNALYQFIHDVDSHDGIDRYYVYFKESDKEILRKQYRIPESKLLKNKTLKHQIYYLSATRIVTSFVDSSFYQPIGADRYKNYYSEWCAPEIIYLQHGVLHAKGLHYASEFLNIDKVVISTTIEERYYRELGFRDDQLIETGVSRYTQPRRNLAVTTRIRKVLYLPSWRSYLADKQQNNRWVTNVNKFKASDLYKEIKKLGELAGTSDIDIVIDVQPHPILNTVSDLFKSCGFTVKAKCNISDYDLIVTDYSSIVYDAVYAGIPIIYFCPDRKQFDNGLNFYCEILTPMDDGFGPLSENAEDLLKNLLSVRDNASQYVIEYNKKYEGLFLDFTSPIDEFYRKVYGNVNLE